MFQPRKTRTALTACALTLLLNNNALAATPAAKPEDAGESERAEPAQLQIGAEARAEMLPLWELGLAGLYVSGKDYPGSDNDNARLFPVPYGKYRGEKIRVGDGGVKAVAFENPRYSLDLSIAASVNANSEDNALRENLPDIDYMFELGPQLIVTVYDRFNHDGTRSEMTFSTQLRAAFSTDFSEIKSRGGVLSTVLEWERGGFLDGRMGYFGSIAPKWASSELQQVFYQVDQEFATSDRAAYDAKGGYLGTDVSLGLGIKALPSLWLYGAVGQSFYQGAANEDSPLFETDSSGFFWLGALWQLKTSSKLVEVLRD